MSDMENPAHETPTRESFLEELELLLEEFGMLELISEAEAEAMRQVARLIITGRADMVN